MIPQPTAKKAFGCFTPQDIIIPKRQEPGHSYPRDDKLQNDLEKKATVLGSIQILCCLTISSLGNILVFASYSSHFNPAVSTMLMFAYPSVGTLFFAMSGFLSIISGKKPTMPFAVSSLVSNALSSIVAGTGLFLLIDNLVTLWMASQLCDSGKGHLYSLPYSWYYYSVFEVNDCVQDKVSLTGVLVVMLVFTVLELLLVAYSSVFWWKQGYSNNPGSSFSLLQSQDPIKHVGVLQGHGCE
ncbi:membrane-spanning 4-domains subfamily A member 7-like [Rhynchonycteris naso]